MDIYPLMLLRKCISLYWDDEKGGSEDLYRLMEQKLEYRLSKAAIKSWLTKKDRMNPGSKTANLLCELLPNNHPYYKNWEAFLLHEEKHDLLGLTEGKNMSVLRNNAKIFQKLKKNVSRRALDIYSGKAFEEKHLSQAQNIPALPKNFAYRGRLMKALDSDLQGIYELALKDNMYGSSELNPPSVKLRWKVVNDNTFYVVKDKEGIVVGNLNVLPLTEACYLSIRNGEIEEKEISGNDIIPDSDRESIKYLYIEGFRCLYVQIMYPFLYNMSRILQNIANIKNEIFIGAYAGTIDGEAILIDYGFKKVSQYKALSQNFYEARFVEIYDKISNRFGECYL